MQLAQTLGDLLLPVIAAGSVAFVVINHRLARWWSDEVGRMVMGIYSLFAVLIGLAMVAAAVRATHDGVLPGWWALVRLAVFMWITYLVWRMAYLPIKIRADVRRARPRYAAGLDAAASDRPGHIMTKLLGGREPAVYAALVQAALSMLVAFQLDWLNGEQAALITATISALSGAFVAWRTRPIAPAAFTAVVTAGAALAAGYGFDLGQEVVGSTTAAVTALVLFFGVRPQVSPTDDKGVPVERRSW